MFQIYASANIADIEALITSPSVCNISVQVQSNFVPVLLFVCMRVREREKERKEGGAVLGRFIVFVINVSLVHVVWTSS
jgi:hypothetical protein